MATHKILKANDVRSLVWSGDELVDWAGGGARYGLDGSTRRSSVNYAYRFDTAVTSNDGRFSVIYERTGTKGLVLREGEILREINRSFYQAHVYEYPICIWTRVDGRTLMAHCPEGYSQIDINDVETGERLTESSERKFVDFFHSRLQVNPGGTRLLSAGWVWHPIDCVQFLDIPRKRQDTGSLDKGWEASINKFHMGFIEECAACWQTDDRLIVAAGREEEPPEDDENHGDALCLHPNGVVVYDIPNNTCVHSIQLPQPAGTVMPVGEDSVVAFYEHPRLISLVDGEILQEWPNIPSGKQLSSIIRDYRPPPMALDPANRRFAVVQDDKIHVVTL